MAAFGDDEFCERILLLYSRGRDNNYFLKLNEDEVDELKEIYTGLYISPENINHYDDAQIMKKLMIAIVSVHNLEKDVMRSTGELLQLVNSVKYDGKNMYMNMAKISCVKMRRLLKGKTQKEIAEKIGYSISTIRNCEKFECDLTRQPEILVSSLADALGCDMEDLYNGTI